MANSLVAPLCRRQGSIKIEGDVAMAATDGACTWGESQTPFAAPFIETANAAPSTTTTPNRPNPACL